MPTFRGRVARASKALAAIPCLICAVVLALPIATFAQGTPIVAPRGSGDRLLEGDDVRFFIDPNSSAAGQAEEWRESRPEDAAAMDVLAAQPVADWYGDWVEDIEVGVDGRVTQIAETGALPLLVAYNIPFRDCGQYSAGGQNDPEGYRIWIEAFAAGIGDRPAVVILEPDGLTLTDCLDEVQTQERFDLLAHAVETLEALPAVDVYIDAGHSDWLEPEDVADRLRQAGIDRAAGFALNTSNFQTTDDLTAYGLEVSEAIGAEGGTHFVIDTSRNGLGPWESDDPEAWCNPPDRAVGLPPSTETEEPLLDAQLWVKRVGESDGSCRGAPPAGQWYPEYALGLIQRSELAP